MNGPLMPNMLQRAREQRKRIAAKRRACAARELLANNDRVRAAHNRLTSERKYSRLRKATQERLSKATHNETRRN